MFLKQLRICVFTSCAQESNISRRTRSKEAANCAAQQQRQSNRASGKTAGGRTIDRLLRKYSLGRCYVRLSAASAQRQGVQGENREKLAAAGAGSINRRDHDGNYQRMCSKVATVVRKKDVRRSRKRIRDVSSCTDKRESIFVVEPSGVLSSADSLQPSQRAAAKELRLLLADVNERERQFSDCGPITRAASRASSDLKYSDEGLSTEDASRRTRGGPSHADVDDDERMTHKGRNKNRRSRRIKMASRVEHEQRTVDEGASASPLAETVTDSANSGDTPSSVGFQVPSQFPVKKIGANPDDADGVDNTVAAADAPEGHSDEPATNAAQCAADAICDAVVCHAKKKKKYVKRKRVYDKCHACLYCGKLVKLKMKRHLSTVHRNEPEVKALLNLSSETQRRIGFLSLANRGNFKHNTSVLNSDDGTLIVCHRSKGRSTYDYLPCVHCASWFVSACLWQHVKHCPFRGFDGNDDTRRFVVKTKNARAAGRLLMEGAAGSCVVHVPPKFRDEVLAKLRDDSISVIVRYDSLILKYGMVLHRKLGRQRTHDISQKMRQLGRLLQAIAARGGQLMKSGRSKVSLNQCLSGSSFDVVVRAVEDLCSRHESASGRPLFSNPTLALKLGQSLVKCAEIKRGAAIRAGNSSMQQQADAFLALHRSEWAGKVSATSIATLKCRRYNNPEILPPTSDLVKLKTFQEQAIVRLTKELKQKSDYRTWRELLEFVYCRVVIFNKRRCGETARLLLSAYKQRPEWKKVASDEILKTLQPSERQLLCR
jgi:hypothetical protein